MKAIIYSRKSTSGQDNSLSRQNNELKTVEGYKIVKTFSESISGYTKSAYDRPELQKAIKYAIDNKIEVIMVHELSRLGRRTHEVLNILEDLKSRDIKVYVKSLNLLVGGNGVTQALNQLLVTLLIDLCRMESETLSYRIKSGLQERKRKGLSIGRQEGSTESPDKFLAKHKNVIRELKNDESVRRAAKICGVSPTTVQKVKYALAECK